MRRFKERFALAAATLGLCLLGAAGAAAQQATGTVIGQVTDGSTSRPVASAQVFVAGTQRGALTNAEGRYVINAVPAGSQTVRVTVLGYTEGTHIVTVAKGASVTANFVLQPSAVELNAVVVSAVTGTRERKAEIGANVTNINLAEVNKGQVQTFSDVLNGRTAGVDMRSVTGGVGTGQKIRIRGATSLSLSNEPIIYIDGMRYNAPTGTGFGVGGQDVSRLNDLNPEDIANIEVLKGPAASAMYGTAAANGVLLITTKRGRAGKASWHGYAEMGSIQDKTDYPTNYFAYQLNTPGAPLLTADGVLDRSARRPCYTFQAAAGTCRQDSVMSFNTLMDPRTTPFIKGYRTNYGLSASGGTDAATYFISGDWQREQGVISFNTNNQVNLRSNVDAHLRPDLDVTVSAGYTSGHLSRPNGDNSVLSPLINGLIGGGLFYPNLADGRIDPNNYGWGLSIHDLAQVPTFQDVGHLVLSTHANYRPFAWLSANVVAGLDRSSTHDYDTMQPVPADNPLAPYEPQDANGNGTGYTESRLAEDLTYTMNASATASQDLTSTLNSATTVGASYTKNHYYDTYGYGDGIVQGTTNLGAASAHYAVDEGFSELIQLGAFAQEKLSYDDRIFLSGGVRTDQNSAFGRKYGRVYYPSASLSWQISKESFFPKPEWLNTVRLRSAWGQSGRAPGFRQAVTYFGPVAATDGGASVPAVTLSATGNELLKPERTTEYEVGGDVGLLNERLSAEFTYFHKRTKDALVSKPLPADIGLTASMFDNLASLQNTGTELALNALALNRENVKLNLRVSASTLNNKILDLGTGINPIAVGRTQKHIAGYTAGGFWQKQYTYNDANHDGKICYTRSAGCPVPEVTLLYDSTSAAKDGTSFLGPVLPTFERSFSGELTVFKLVTVSTLFDWKGGNKQQDFTEPFRCANATAFGDRGCYENMDPHASLADQAAYAAYRLGSNAGFVEDAGFVKWRELAVTVNPPEALVSRFGLAKGASITFSGRNLATWTKYRGLDPELNETGGGANFGSDEFNTQPPLRYYTVRLNFQF